MLRIRINCIENLGLEPPEFLDSKSWQHNLLGKETKGRENLKMASMHLGQKLYPQLFKEIQKQKDSDSILIAYYIKQRLLLEGEINK